MAVKEVKAEPVRLYQRLDSIADSRKASDLSARRREIAVSEQTIMPINPGGWQDPGRAYMLSEVAMANAAKAEQIREIESLEGDDLVLRYCQDCVTPPRDAGVTINGAPLGRGGAPSMVAPGMF